MTNSIQIQMWGGVNYREQSDALVGRSMSFDNGVWSHRFGANGLIPLESPFARNFDFERQNIRKRKGHILFVNLTNSPNIFLSGDSLIDGIEYVSGATNQRVFVVVSKKTIYLFRLGAWTIIGASGGGNYTHADPNITDCSFAVVDNHLFIGLDGSNKIQTYRSGTALDQEMNNGNTYNDSFGGGTHAINGTWSSGYKIVVAFQNRLLFSKGDTIMEYTNTSAIYDRLNGGFDLARGQILASTVHTPDYTNSLATVLFMFTSVGVEFKTSFDPSATIEVLQGAWPILGPGCLTRCKNWMVYMTVYKTILAINGNSVIDVGRRLNSRGLLAADPTAVLGPLDTLNVQAPTAVYSYFNEFKAQSTFLIPTGSSAVSDTAAIIDFSLGEPSVGEPQISYETYIRCVHWDNIQHVAAFNTRDFGVLYIQSNGNIWQSEQGNADYGSQAINGWWRTPDFHVNLLANDKNWLLHFNREIQTGNWNMRIDFYLNRSQAIGRTLFVVQANTPSSIYDVSQYDASQYSDVQMVKGSDDTDLYGETLALQFSNSNVNETFDLINIEQRYNVATEER